MKPGEVPRVTRPSYTWDEDEQHVYLRLDVPGVLEAPGRPLEVHWTPEGGVEVSVGRYSLIGQLRYRVSTCSWRLLDKELELVFRKHKEREWGTVWLQGLDDDDVEVHLRRERGLATRPREVSATSVKARDVFCLPAGGGLSHFVRVRSPCCGDSGLGVSWPFRLGIPDSCCTAARA
jgi:hypothetical protein